VRQDDRRNASRARTRPNRGTGANECGIAASAGGSGDSQYTRANLAARKRELGLAAIEAPSAKQEYRYRGEKSSGGIGRKRNTDHLPRAGRSGAHVMAISTVKSASLEKVPPSGLIVEQTAGAAIGEYLFELAGPEAPRRAGNADY